MSLAAFGLIAAAAGAHATWNFFAKQAHGGLPFVWLAGVCAVTLYTAPAVAALVLNGHGLSVVDVAFRAGSGALHGLYLTTLQRGYAEGDFSVVYPLARGTGPALSVLAAIVVIGERPGPLALAGAALVVAGVFALLRGGRRVDARALTFALLAGAAIAAYTLWDAHAVQALRLAPLLYYWGSEVARTIILAAPALHARQHLRTTLVGDRSAILVIGLLSPLAYILVLQALTLAPVSVVAPGREASIVIASLLGSRVLREGHLRRRLIAAIVILAGIACLVLA